MMENKMQLIRIRAVTAFISLNHNDFNVNSIGDCGISTKIGGAREILNKVENALICEGYEVQTLRIATNPFGEYLSPASHMKDLQDQLSQLNSSLEKANIDFFAVGPATTIEEIESCPIIVSSSHRISCSASMRSGNDVIMAKAAAECIKKIAHLGDTIPGDHVKDGLGNFRFCSTACCKPFTPFFPAAMGPSFEEGNNMISFSIGLENGKLSNVLLDKSATLDNISSIFKEEMTNALFPIQRICEEVSESTRSLYMGIDTSLNPSLDENGSVAESIEKIDIVQKFGGSGSISVAAEITNALKNLPGIKKVGYCGLMLPVCEDRRLANLASSRDIDTTKLLAISSVCGVGLDTIPVPDCDEGRLAGLILDVASLSFRYNKSLSCRLLVCPGSKEGDETCFNSPYMCECKIFDI